MVYKLFVKNSASLTDKFVSGGGVGNNEIKQNFQLVNQTNQTKYGLIKELNFTIIILKNG